MMRTLPVRSVVVLALGGLLLAGCGGSDDSPSSVSKPEPKPKKYDNIHVDVTPSQVMDKPINIYMGDWHPCTTTHPEMCIDPSKAVPPIMYTQTNRNNKITEDPQHQEFTVDPADLKRFAKETGLIPVETSIFADGHFSVLDVMIYLSETRDDFQMTLGEYDPVIASTPFTVSYDYNRDGKFSEEDGAENFNSPDWYGAFMYSDGDWMRMVGQGQAEPLYARLEEFLVKNDMHIRLRAFSPGMTERRRSRQAIEVERLEANGGKVVVPVVRAKYSTDHDAHYEIIATDVEVTPHNLRLDVFKPGVITVADLAMSAHEQGLADFEFTFWPTLATNAEVGAYVITSVQGQRAEGWVGWDFFSGETSSDKDFFWTPKYPSPEMLVLADMGKLAQVMIEQQGIDPQTAQMIEQAFKGQCRWVSEKTGGIHTPESAKACIDDFYGYFGGNSIHQTPDIAVMRYPRGSLSMNWNTHQAKMFEVSQRNLADDGQGDIYDITRAVAPLDSGHFGWGIADCGTCHSLDKTHVGGDAPHLPDVVQPHYCASCHGSNGAPTAHGEQARCFWCHSKDRVMVNHGDASKRRPISEEECQGTAVTGTDLDGFTGYCADRVSQSLPFMAPHKRDDNVSSYKELLPNLTTQGNSDWHTSETFPDPYSCVTCHPSE